MEGTKWNLHPEWGPEGTEYYNKRLAELEAQKEQAAQRKEVKAKRKAAKDAEPVLV